jgi:V8-like Glu-specific endopeptidase
MPKKWKFIVAVILVGASLGAGYVVAQSETTAIQASGDSSTVAEYWTAERASEAQAMPFYDASADGPASVAPERVGPAGSAPGGLPSRNAQADAAPAAGNDATAANAAAAPDAQSLDAADEDGIDFGTPDIGDNDSVNKNTKLWKQYPYKTIGKLMFTTPSGSGYCTASVVSPNNIIVTAAHCCYTRGQGWHNNWAFAPAMRKTTRPYGTFPWASARILTAWIDAGGRQNDVCVLTTGRNEFGQTLSATVGWLGRSWNFPSVQHHFAFGYPSNIDGGLYKYEASAESYANCGDANVNAMGSNMTFGSSGGPWVRVFKRFASGAMNYVNTVVSGYDACTGTFGQSFNGARFTSNNIVPLCTAEGC